MHQALKVAEHAERDGEVPVGAVLVQDQQIICTASNQTITQCDPTAHAEILLLRLAAKQLKNPRLLGSTVYVTLEPCLMCLGAMHQARIKRLVFGAYDSRFGGTAHLQLLQTKDLNHTFELTDGLLANQCAEKLQQFFKKKRKKSEAIAYEKTESL